MILRPVRFIRCIGHLVLERHASRSFSSSLAHAASCVANTYSAPTPFPVLMYRLQGLRVRIRFIVTLLSNSHQVWRSANETNKQERQHDGAHIVTIKSITIPLKVEYLEKAAKERGISRSRLVRFVMEKVVSDEVVPAILGEGDLSNVEPHPQKYRRFRHPA
jgi:hypothetical protein